MSHAAQYGHADVVRAVLDAKAKVNMSDKLGQTPLSYVAGGWGDADVVKLLLQVKAEVNLDLLEWTPLSCTAENGYADVVNMLVEAGPRSIYAINQD